MPPSIPITRGAVVVTSTSLAEHTGDASHKPHVHRKPRSRAGGADGVVPAAPRRAAGPRRRRRAAARQTLEPRGNCVDPPAGAASTNQPPARTSRPKRTASRAGQASGTPGRASVPPTVHDRLTGVGPSLEVALAAQAPGPGSTWLRLTTRAPLSAPRRHGVLSACRRRRLRHRSSQTATAAGARPRTDSPADGRLLQPGDRT